MEYDSGGSTCLRAAVGSAPGPLVTLAAASPIQAKVALTALLIAPAAFLMGTPFRAGWAGVAPSAFGAQGLVHQLRLQRSQRLLRLGSGLNLCHAECRIGTFRRRRLRTDDPTESATSQANTPSGVPAGIAELERPSASCPVNAGGLQWRVLFYIRHPEREGKRISFTAATATRQAGASGCGKSLFLRRRSRFNLHGGALPNPFLSITMPVVRWLPI
jgi:hypothetical protein